MPSPTGQSTFSFEKRSVRLVYPGLNTEKHLNDQKTYLKSSPQLATFCPFYLMEATDNRQIVRQPDNDSDSVDLQIHKNKHRNIDEMENKRALTRKLLLNHLFYTYYIIHIFKRVYFKHHSDYFITRNIKKS